MPKVAMEERRQDDTGQASQLPGTNAKGVEDAERFAFAREEESEEPVPHFHRPHERDQDEWDHQGPGQLFGYDFAGIHESKSNKKSGRVAPV